MQMWKPNDNCEPDDTIQNDRLKLAKVRQTFSVNTNYIASLSEMGR